MKRLVEYPLADGNTVCIEIDEPQTEGLTRASRAGDVAEKVTQGFEDALGKVKPALGAISAFLKDLADSPDEAAVEFGVKFGLKAGAFIASADTEAQFVFKLVWKKDTQTSNTNR